MKKRLLNIGIIVILVIMLIILTGCGNNQDGQSNTNNDKISKNSLASKVKVGDYVDYKTVADNKYTSTSDKTGYTKDQVFITTGEEKWRVLDVAEDGTVTLISEEQIKTNQNDTYYLLGAKGYENSVSELNNIASIYANGDYAVSGRHLTREDVNNLIGIEKFARYNNVELSNYNTELEKWDAVFSVMDENYGKERTISSVNNTKQYKVDANSSEGKVEVDSSKETPNYYEVKLSDFEEENSIYQELLNGRYWLANKVIRYTSNSSVAGGKSEYFNYEIGYLSSASSSKGKFNLDAEYDSVSLVCGGNYSTQPGYTNYNRYVRPIVVLDKEVNCDGGTGTSSDPYILD